MKKTNNREIEPQEINLCDEIRDILKKYNPSPNVALTVLASMICSMCESLNISEREFKDLMQDIVNLYCAGIGDGNE